MQDITLTIDKSQVWNEVAKATAYTGAKMVSGEDPGAYDRISTTDQDREMMERFWVEACQLMTQQLKEHVKTVATQEIHHGVDLESDYAVTLRVADSYPTALNDAVLGNLTSFVIATVLSKWFRLANKGETEAYATEASAYLLAAVDLLFNRKRPTRPS